jgi:hypothetical protein
MNALRPLEGSFEEFNDLLNRFSPTAYILLLGILHILSKPLSSYVEYYKHDR